MQDHIKKKSAALAAAALVTASLAAGSHKGPLSGRADIKVTTAHAVSAGSEIAGVKTEAAGGWNEMLYIVVSGITGADVTGVSTAARLRFLLG